VASAFGSSLRGLAGERAKAPLGLAKCTASLLEELARPPPLHLQYQVIGGEKAAVDGTMMLTA
jgi:hypothetical protein